jgi:hypothetical protein
MGWTDGFLGIGLEGSRDESRTQEAEERRPIREHDMLPFEHFPVLSTRLLGFSPIRISSALSLADFQDA